MSIPLVQKPEKDDINTSIIAIKRNIERINMLLGLVDSGSDPDLSGLATKQELQDAVTELTPVDEVTIGNMHSVTSNAVAKALNYSNDEVNTGIKAPDGKDIYRKVFSTDSYNQNTEVTFSLSSLNIFKIYGLRGTHKFYDRNNNIILFRDINYYFDTSDRSVAFINSNTLYVTIKASYFDNTKSRNLSVTLEYTKTTD